MYNAFSQSATELFVFRSLESYGFPFTNFCKTPDFNVLCDLTILLYIVSFLCIQYRTRKERKNGNKNT